MSANYTCVICGSDLPRHGKYCRPCRKAKEGEKLNWLRQRRGSCEDHGCGYASLLLSYNDDRDSHRKRMSWSDRPVDGLTDATFTAKRGKRKVDAD